MMPFRRKERQRPASVQQLEGAHGRALAWGITAADEPVIATIDALVLGDGTTLPWHLIDKAGWQPPVFAIRHRDARTGAPRRLEIELSAHGELPPVVRERVTRSVVISRRVALQGELGAVVAARRDCAGSVTWTVSFDPGLDAADPKLQQQAREALGELRQSYGA